MFGVNLSISFGTTLDASRTSAMPMRPPTREKSMDHPISVTVCIIEPPFFTGLGYTITVINSMD